MRGRAALLLAAAMALACAARGGDGTGRSGARPTRVVLVMVDQLRADLIDLGPMPNLRTLRDRGATFPDAYLGHLGSKTVVSHAVVTRGVFPRRLGWTDDVGRDHEGRIGPKGALWDTGGLSLDQFRRLLPRDVPTFAQAFPAHPRRASIAQKDYSAFTMAGHDADIVLTISGKKSAEEAGAALAGWMAPMGERVPAYIAEPKGGRFWLDGRPAFGTEAWSYSIGGTKFWPGDDPAHRGGDAWVVDAALAIMDHEDWGVLTLSLGMVDRVGHMMGNSRDLETPNPTPVRFREALAEADRQIGRLLEGIRARGLDDETLVVVTADHGGMPIEDLRAQNRPGKAGYDWNWGQYQNLDRREPQPDVAALLAGGGVEGTSTDTAVRVWATPGDPAAASLPDRVKGMPGVISVWKLVERDGAWRYEETFRDLSKLPAGERTFQEKHLAELLASSASPASADVVGILDHRTGYAVPGDHGGTQRAVQWIPLVFSGPNVRPGAHRAEARLVDVAATVWALAGEPPPPKLDGVPLCEAVVSSPACAR